MGQPGFGAPETLSKHPMRALPLGLSTAPPKGSGGAHSGRREMTQLRTNGDSTPPLTAEASIRAALADTWPRMPRGSPREVPKGGTFPAPPCASPRAVSEEVGPEAAGAAWPRREQEEGPVDEAEAEPGDDDEEGADVEGTGAEDSDKADATRDLLAIRERRRSISLPTRRLKRQNSIRNRRRVGSR